MSDFFAFLLFCWVVFMVGAVCILVTYAVCHLLRSILKGEI